MSRLGLASLQAGRTPIWFNRGRTRLWTAATSFGGVHSTIDRRAQWGGDAVEPGFVRLSCGIEDTADLVADLAAGLDGLA